MKTLKIDIVHCKVFKPDSPFFEVSVSALINWEWGREADH
jgi:hypothetical protein